MHSGYMSSAYKLKITRNGKTAFIVSRDAFQVGKKMKWGSGAMWTVESCEAA